MHSALGLATHFVPASKWETLHARLREPNADQHLDGMLAELHQKEPPKEPAIPWELINKHFGKESLAAVIDSLAADSSPLAQSTLESLRKLSPTALHVWLPHRVITASLLLAAVLVGNQTSSIGMHRSCFHSCSVAASCRSRSASSWSSECRSHSWCVLDDILDVILAYPDCRIARDACTMMNITAQRRVC